MARKAGPALEKARSHTYAGFWRKSKQLHPSNKAKIVNVSLSLSLFLFHCLLISLSLSLFLISFFFLSLSLSHSLSLSFYLSISVSPSLSLSLDWQAIIFAYVCYLIVLEDPKLTKQVSRFLVRPFIAWDAQGKARMEQQLWLKHFWVSKPGSTSPLAIPRAYREYGDEVKTKFIGRNCTAELLDKGRKTWKAPRSYKLTSQVDLSLWRQSWPQGFWNAFFRPRSLNGIISAEVADHSLSRLGFHGRKLSKVL